LLRNENLPSRKWHTVSIAMPVQALLPIRLPEIFDRQIFGGKSHSFTSTCWFVVTVIWYVGAGGVLLCVVFPVPGTVAYRQTIA